MALIESTMLPLGTRAPDFELTDVTSGRQIDLATFSGQKALLVMFICRHCPFVRHVEREIAKLGHDYGSKAVGIIAISSNDALAYPGDSPASLRQQAQEAGFNFPYCYDETQAIARAYTAACTPDFFLFDRDRELVYRGQLDDSRPDNGKPVNGADLRSAIDAVLKDLPVPDDQKPSIGCNIKWRE